MSFDDALYTLGISIALAIRSLDLLQFACRICVDMNVTDILPTLRTHFRGLQNSLKSYKSVWLLNFSILGNPIEDYLHAKPQRGDRCIAASDIPPLKPQRGDR